MFIAFFRILWNRALWQLWRSCQRTIPILTSLSSEGQTTSLETASLHSRLLSNESGMSMAYPPCFGDFHRGQGAPGPVMSFNYIVASSRNWTQIVKYKCKVTDHQWLALFAFSVLTLIMKDIKILQGKVFKTFLILHSQVYPENRVFLGKRKVLFRLEFLVWPCPVWTGLST